MIGQFEKDKEELENQLSNLQRERDNSLLMAENDKQQVNRLVKLSVRILESNCLCSYPVGMQPMEMSTKPLCIVHDIAYRRW